MKKNLPIEKELETLQKFGISEEEFKYIFNLKELKILNKKEKLIIQKALRQY